MTVVFDRVGYAYPGSTRGAVSDLTFTARPGEVTLMTGRLGSGCSTALLLAAGFAPRLLGGTRTGTVTTFGVDPGSPEGWRETAGRVGVLLPTPWTQLSGMSYTVADEVAFGPANLGRDRDAVIASAREAMALLEVDHLAMRDPNTLSGGELQRVVLAGLVAMAPDVFLLDEPAMELDPQAAAALYTLLRSLAARGIVLLASTDVDRAVEIADRVLYLEGGRLVADGRPADVLGSERVAAADGGGAVAALFRDAGADPQHPITVDGALERLRS